jgi:Fe-S-cluster containining protein
MQRKLPIIERSVTVQSQTDETARQHMAQMLGYLDAILALEGLEDFAKTKTLPTRLFALWVAALDCYDKYIEYIISAEGWQISCRRGCSACCQHELARGVTALEAIAIYRYVRSWKDIETLYEHSGQNMVTFQQLLAAEIQADPRPLEPNDPRIVSAHLQYNQLQRPCAFLDQEQGVCRIYPVRPIVCRFFFNLSPAEWCVPTHEAYLERDTRGIDPHSVVKERIDAINKRLGVRVLHFLAGAFVSIAGEVMEGQPLKQI